MALDKSVGIIKKRSKFIKAMNIIIADEERQFLSTYYSEDPEYFGMWYKKIGNDLLICSEKYPDEKGWQRIENNFTGEIK